MIGSTSKITISEKPFGINQIKMGWSRLKNLVVLIKPKWTGWNYWHHQVHLKLPVWRSYLCHPCNILTNLHLSYQTSTLIFLVPWYQVKWLDDHLTVHRVLSQFHFLQRFDRLAVEGKNLVAILVVATVQK